MSTPSGINSAMQELRKRYQKDLPAKLSEIDSLLLVLNRAEKFEPETLNTLHRSVHSLTGSGATFGLSALSDAARILEATLKECERENTSRVPDALLKKIGEQWNAVKFAAARPDAVPEQEVEMSTNVKPCINADEATKKENGYLLLLEDDVEQARNLQLQLRHFGYTAKVLHDNSLSNDAIAEAVPSVIIMDVDFPGGGLAGPQTITGLSEETKARIPVIFLSSRGDIASRLSAIRAGAAAYFTKPVDMAVLIEKLDK